MYTHPSNYRCVNWTKMAQQRRKNMDACKDGLKGTLAKVFARNHACSSLRCRGPLSVIDYNAGNKGLTAPNQRPNHTSRGIGLEEIEGSTTNRGRAHRIAAASLGLCLFYTNFTGIQDERRQIFTSHDLNQLGSDFVLRTRLQEFVGRLEDRTRNPQWAPLLDTSYNSDSKGNPTNKLSCCLLPKLSFLSVAASLWNFSNTDC